MRIVLGYYYWPPFCCCLEDCTGNRNWKEMNCIDWLGLYSPELYGLDRVELNISLRCCGPVHSLNVSFISPSRRYCAAIVSSSSLTDDLFPDCICISAAFLFILFSAACIAFGPKYKSSLYLTS